MYETAIKNVIYDAFQSYLYGIEISFTPGLSSNIMFCFNRTFMELKFLQLPSYPCCRCVSIVPLWNWNGLAGCVIRLLLLFQSYLYGIEMIAVYILQAAEVVRFNRTFMELKLLVYHGRSRRTRCFNRTFMELKFPLHPACHQTSCFVSIVPLWNWNFYSYHRTHAADVFQSYLYGIEMGSRAA